MSVARSVEHVPSGPPHGDRPPPGERAAAPAVADGDAPPAADTALEAWQRLLLPFLVALLAGVTVFFLWATLRQLEQLQADVEAAPRAQLDAALAGLSVTPDMSPGDRLAHAQWRTLAELERNAMERRYHQANVLLMARTWTRYLGFVTGMIMALVGAGFILGRFRESGTALSVDGPTLKGALSTASPGIVLATLGTALMMATILVHNDITTRDVPLYTTYLLVPDADGAAPSMLPSADGAAPPHPDSLLRSVGPRAPGGREP